MKTTKQQGTGRGSGGVTGKGFKPGKSGNPGGRPRSMAASILDVRPTMSRDLAAFWNLITFGSTAEILKQLGEAPTLSDRMEAAKQLADRLHGKPVQTHELVGPGGGPIHYRSLSDDALDERIKHLERKIGKAARR